MQSTICYTKENNSESDSKMQEKIIESFDSIDENNQPVDKFCSDEILGEEENLDFPPMISMQGKHIGSRRYIWAGYVYVRDGYSQTFRCSNREQYRCPGRAIIKNGDVKETKKHSHPREPHILPLEQAKEKMLLRAQLNRSLSLRTIYLEACQTDPLVSSHLDLDRMLNKMKKVRRRNRQHLRSSKVNAKRKKKSNWNFEWAKDWLEMESRLDDVARCKICLEDIVHPTKVQLYNHSVSETHKRAALRRYQSLNEESQPEEQDHFVRNDEDTIEKTTDDSESDQKDTYDIEVLEQFREDSDRMKAAKIFEKRKISVHISDPETASGLHISLHRLENDIWDLIERTKTDEHGKCDVLLEGKNLAIGLHKLNLDTRSYYSLRNQKCLYPYIEIVFDVENTDEPYHFSVQLSSFGYNVSRLSKS